MRQNDCVKRLRESRVVAVRGELLNGVSGEGLHETGGKDLPWLLRSYGAKGAA